MMRTTGNDRGAARMITITRLVIVLAIVGVLGYDGFSIMSAHVNTENDAQTAAYAASQAYNSQSNHNLPAAYAAAVASVRGKGETVLTTGFTANADGTIHLTVQRIAPTVVIKHFGSLHSWTVVTERGDANSLDG
jgi:hypothetical protein